jgi:hypothetical protein
MVLLEASLFKGGPWETDKPSTAPIDVGGLRLVTLPPAGALAAESTSTGIAWLSCAGDPPNGLYVAADLAERKPLATIEPAALQGNTSSGIRFAFECRATSRDGGKAGREPARNVLLYLRTGSAGPTQPPARIVARR